MSEQKIDFESKWTAWYHEKKSRDWSMKSYKKSCVISNNVEFWDFISSFQYQTVKDKTIYISRDDIKPVWEDPANKKGGHFNFTTSHENSHNLLCQILLFVLGETLLPLEYTKHITVITCTADEKGCLIQLWFDEKIASNVKKIYEFMDLKAFNLKPFIKNDNHHQPYLNWKMH